MPEISRFFGMVIFMYYNEHAPPHFHVRYEGRDVMISIADLSLIKGSLSPRALSLVKEWANAHRSELLEDWQRGRDEIPFKPIAPLE